MKLKLIMDQRAQQRQKFYMRQCILFNAWCTLFSYLFTLYQFQFWSKL